MTTLTVDFPQDVYERFAALAEAEGKTMDEYMLELVEQALPPVSFAHKSAREILKEAGMLTELSDELKALIGDDPPSLDEVIEILSNAGGPSLGEILDKQRGPKP
jgi:predicted DNA-binding protein